MPYRDMFTDDIYQNEFDETMTRKFPNTYKVIKTIYPDAYKLPEDEIHTMSNILRHQGDTYDEAESLLKKHINQKQPQWNLDYLGGKDKSPSDWLHHGLEQNLNKLEFPKPKTFQPYPDTDEYPKYQPDEFLPNGDIDFQKVYQRVKKENPNYSIKGYNNKWYPKIQEDIFALPNILYDYIYYKNKGLHDKYKHSMINCRAYQKGPTNKWIIDNLSDLKELYDQNTWTPSRNTPEESAQDMGANYIGQYLGDHYPDIDCGKLISPYISKKYPYKF